MKNYLAVFLLMISTACTDRTTVISPTTEPPSNQTNQATVPAVIPSSTRITAPAVVPTATMAQVTSTPTMQPVSTSTISPTVSNPNPLALQIEQVKMFNKDLGWAIGSEKGQEKIWSIADGGKVWKDVTPSLQEEYISGVAYYKDATNAYVIFAKQTSPNEVKYQLSPWRTSDSGRTWQSGKVLTVDFRAEFGLNQLYFLDKNQGWLLGSVSMGHSYEIGSALYETKDGGMNWEKVYDPIDQFKAMGGEAVLWWPIIYPFQTDRLVFIDQKVGFFAGSSLYRTQDGGHTWIPLSIARPPDAPPTEKPCCNQLVSLPKFLSANEGTLIQQVYKELPAGGEINRFYQIPDVTYLQYTHDGGQTWTPQPAPAKMGSDFFLNKEIGWYLGKDNSDPNGLTQLYQTRDGGRTWETIVSECMLPLGSRIQFLDEQAGFAFNLPIKSYYYLKYDKRIGTAPTIFYTEDGGHSWVKIEMQLIP